MRGRCRTTTYVYDDPDHPDRVTSTVESPDWTGDDWALMQALEMWESTLLACGWPAEQAYHTDLDGWWKKRSYKCHPCSELNGDDVFHDHVTLEFPPDRELIPFEWDVTVLSRES